MDPVDILVVDDTPANLLAVETILSQPDRNIVKASSGKEALKILLERDFALILLDINMAGMDGFETASLIRQRKSCELTPIIFMTANNSAEANLNTGYSLGAVDYVFAPLDPQILRSKAAFFVELYKKNAELASINDALRGEIEERRKVEKAVLEISEKEQRRLGTQIHDDLCQDLVGITMLTKNLAKKMKQKGERESEAVLKIAEFLDHATMRAREMARGFYPIELQSDALMRALRDLSARSEAMHKIVCRFVCPQPILIEDDIVATHLYRIVQEAILNAVNHGRAKMIEIGLLRHRDVVTLTVTDDGKGLQDDPGKRKGIGTQIMKYRARMIEAELVLKNANPCGASLTCSFSHPLEKNILSTGPNA